MAKIITQETFDDVVKENIVEFSMSVEEARDETVQQFEAQGINLHNIIKDLTINPETGLPILNESVAYLKGNGKNQLSGDKNEICKHLATLTDECKLTVPHRVLAASKLGAYDFIVEVLDTQKELDKDIVAKLITAANAIINKQPDIFNIKSLEVISRLLKTETNKTILSDLLRWLHKACVLHENNRQMIMDDTALIKLFKNLVTHEESDVVKNTCALFRFLILDDDIRVEFGKAHEHARTLAAEILIDVTKLLFKFKSDQDLICELLLTIAALTVRNEFCQVVEEAGGVKFIMDAMVEFPESVKLLREACKLLKALAGNDAVKLHIVQNGAASLLESALNRHKGNETFARHALACITTLALRDKESSKALFDTGLPETIIQTMKIHPSSKVVQRNGAWSIRNMVSRSREQCDTFISLGAEDVLNQALTGHPSIAQDIKSALRDLGCKVHLNEEWKAQSEYQIRQDD